MPTIDWMQQGPFGLMVHWLSDIAPPPGGRAFDDWNDMVDAFPVDQFCDQVAATGVGWLIWPFGQNTGRYCSPNACLEALVPGCCSRRDLFREIAEGITQRDMRMLAYLPSAVRRQSDKVRAALGWDLDPNDKREFQRRYAGVVREWSQTMGPLISGWWFDGAYEGPRTDFTYDSSRFDIPEWGEAVRAGNPASIYALNPGANTFQYVSEDEGYLAGEANDLRVRPGRPLIGDKQWHALTWIDCFWMHKDPGSPIDAPRYFDAELHAYLDACHRNGGAVTLNIGIYNDGSMPEASLAQVTRMAELITSGAKPEKLNVLRRRYSI